MAKSIVITRGRAAEIPKQNMPHAIHDTNRYGMWGKVLERYSIDHTVDIETAEGFRVTRVPVTSREWVTLNDPILGERNLPPKGSMVFLFMPTGGIDNAFIFGGCFLPSFGKHTNEFLVEGKEDEELTRIEGNWGKIFDKITGDMEIVGTDEDDKTLVITIKKSEKRIQLTDWNENDILIDENGIAVTDVNGNKITTDSNGVMIDDASGQKIEMASEGITVNTSGKVTIYSAGCIINDTLEVK
jgi:hypothetical protein